MEAKTFPRNGGRLVLCVLLTMLSSVAVLLPSYLISGAGEDLLTHGFSLPLSALVAEFNKLFNIDRFIGAMVVCIVFWMYRKQSATSKRGLHVEALILAVMVSLTSIVGISCRIYSGLTLFTQNSCTALLCACMFLGYVPLFYTAFRLVGAWVDARYPRLPAWTAGRDGLFRACKRPALLIIIVLLLSWTPYLLVFYPGAVPVDTGVQLNNYFGAIPWSNHHPVLSSVLFGVFIQWGRLLGSDNLGIFSYTLFQSAVMAFALSRTLICMREWRVPVRLCRAALLFYCLLPVWGMYAQYAGKDTLYTAVVVLFTTCLCRLLHDPAAIKSNKRLACLLALGVLTALLRNNGIYVVVLSIAASLLVIAGKAGKLRMAALLGVLLLFQCAWNGLLPAFGVAKGSVVEMLSIPLQQTARYVSKYDAEVTPEEKAAIAKVLNYDELGDAYDPRLSDPVKGCFNLDASRKDILGYAGAWLQMFGKHPGVYFEATACNSYTYYSLYGDRAVLFRYYITDVAKASGIFLAHPPRLTPYRSRLFMMVIASDSVPLLNLFYNQGFYTWVLLGLVALLLARKKAYYIACLAPALVSLLVCIASPVNGDIRYFLPVFAVMPLLCASTLAGIYNN